MIQSEPQEVGPGQPSPQDRVHEVKVGRVFGERDVLCINSIDGLKLSVTATAASHNGCTLLHQSPSLTIFLTTILDQSATSNTYRIMILWMHKAAYKILQDDR